MPCRSVTFPNCDGLNFRDIVTKTYYFSYFGNAWVTNFSFSLLNIFVSFHISSNKIPETSATLQSNLRTHLPSCAYQTANIALVLQKRAFT